MWEGLTRASDDESAAKSNNLIIHDTLSSTERTCRAIRYPNLHDTLYDTRAQLCISPRLFDEECNFGIATETLTRSVRILPTRPKREVSNNCSCTERVNTK